MRKVFFVVVMFICSNELFAQRNISDSLAVLLRKETTDTNRVNLLWKMADAAKYYSPDTAMLLSREALSLATSINYREGESRALGIIANGFVSTGNYPKALEFYIRKLTIEEKQHNARSLASVTMNIGIVYFYQEEYDKALTYYKRADSIIEISNVEDFKYNIAVNLGELYSHTKQYDSASAFFQKSLTIAQQRQNSGYIGTSMVGVANVNLRRANFYDAEKNYKDALPYLVADNNEEVICEAQLGLASVYEALGKGDSAKRYAEQAMSLAVKDNFLSWQLKAANFLDQHYRASGQIDSAYAYLVASKALEDSISSKQRIRDLQILTMNEQLRQEDLAEQKRRQKKERMQQLQLLFIGIFIPAFFLFTLLISRKKVHVGVIKMLGVISLLILFEYLTLLLHPYVLEFTHHTPIFELLIFVCIAAVLIRLHHRVESWFIDKLIHARPRPGTTRFQSRKMKIKKPRG